MIGKPEIDAAVDELDTLPYERTAKSAREVEIEFFAEHGFDGEAVIDEAARIATLLQEHATISLSSIEGHASSVLYGWRIAALTLSKQRAQV